MSISIKSRSSYPTSDAENSRARGITRREFLETSAIVCVAGMLTACAPSLGETNPPANPAAATQTPTVIPPTDVPVYYEPPVLEGGIFEPALNPPEYKALATEISGIDPKQLEEHRYTQWYRLYERVNGLEGEASPFSGASLEEARQEFEQAMQQFASEHPEVEVRQVQSEDRASLLTYLVRGTGEGYAVYWGFKSDGAVAFAEPHYVGNNTVLGEVDIPEGLRPVFIYNPEDMHWYLFAVDEQNEAKMWFNTEGATRDNLEGQWEEVENLSNRLIEVQQYLNETIGVSTDKIKLTEVRDLGNGLAEIYDPEGNLMVVEENGTRRLAPFGLSLNPELNFWQRWSGSEWENIYNLSPEDARMIAEYSQSKLIEQPSDDKNETVYSAAEGFMFHSMVNPEKANEMYMAVWDAISQPEYSEAKKYWRALGVTDGQSLVAFARNNVGGLENKPYWLSAEFDGHALYSVQCHPKLNGGIAEYHPLANSGEGIYVDQLSVVALSNKDYQNPFANAWIEYVLSQNPRGNKTLISYGPDGSRWSTWGAAINPFTKRPMLVVANPSLISEKFQQHADVRQLGGVDITFRPDNDPKIIEAYIRSYLQYYNDSLREGNVISGRTVPFGDNYGSPFERSVSIADLSGWVIPADLAE